MKLRSIRRKQSRKTQIQIQIQMKKTRTMPSKSTTKAKIAKSTSSTKLNRSHYVDDDLNLIEKLKNENQIKKCFVKLTLMPTANSAMDEMSPAPPEPRKPGRPGRKPKNSLAAKNAATPPPAKSTDTAEKAKNDEKSENSADTTTETIVEKSDKVNDKSSEKAMERAAKASEKKQAAREMAEAIIDSGGRSKRTRKPNPRYMDEPVVSAKKHLKDDSADSENAEGEDGDDEMQSSDEPRNEGPLKKRMLQKHAIKSGPGRKPGGSAKGTPVNAGRKSIGAVATKRKIEIDIDIDDEHGKKLFLDAQRRLTLVSKKNPKTKNVNSCRCSERHS